MSRGHIKERLGQIEVPRSGDEAQTQSGISRGAELFAVKLKTVSGRGEGEIAGYLGKMRPLEIGRGQQLPPVKLPLAGEINRAVLFQVPTGEIEHPVPGKGRLLLAPAASPKEEQHDHYNIR